MVYFFKWDSRFMLKCWKSMCDHEKINIFFIRDSFTPSFIFTLFMSKKYKCFVLGKWLHVRLASREAYGLEGDGTGCLGGQGPGISGGKNEHGYSSPSLLQLWLHFLWLAKLWITSEWSITNVTMVSKFHVMWMWKMYFNPGV